jgi:hypothetical protein
MATLDQLSAALVNADAAGDSEAATALAAEIKRMRAAPPMDVSPVGSTMQNVAAGAGKFVADTAQGGKQLLDDLAAGAQDKLKDTSFGRGIDWLNSKFGLDSPQAIQERGRADIAETRKLDAPLTDTKAGMGGYALGALATAPLVPATTTYGGAAALGGALGAVQPATSWEERGKNTAFSAVAAPLSQAGVNGMARIIKPNTSQAAKDLIDAGITPTPGQILGGGFKRAEEAATSVPVVGDFIKSAQNRGIDQLNSAVANRALAPIGEELPKDVAGRAAVDYVGSKLGDAYDKLVPKIGLAADAQLGTDLRNLHQMVNSGGMGGAEAEQFNKLLQNRVLSRFQGQGAVTGETFKAMDGDLGRLASNYLRDPSADKRQLGEAILEIQDSLRSALSRSNPQYAKDLDAANTGWAVFKRMQRAASSTGADEGVFNPTQLQAAVKAMDRSKDKGAFARGDALLQDLSDPAKKLMAPKLADSGTPYRLFAELMGAGAIGAHTIPAVATVANPWTAAALTSVPAMYSPLGMTAMKYALAKRPESFGALAQWVRSVAGPAAVAAPALSYANSQ